jgi:hypothetical protein
MKIEINAELIYEFHSFSDWVNKASTHIGGFPRSETIICVDKNGNSCSIGKDFMHARDNDLFPVKAYRLIRNTELWKQLEKH